MKFRLNTKTYCKECRNVSYIQKGLNSQDYRSIIGGMAFVILVLILEIAHLWSNQQ